MAPMGSPRSQAELPRPTTGTASVLIAATVAGRRVTSLLCAAKQKMRATVAASRVPRAPFQGESGQVGDGLDHEGSKDDR